MNSSQVIIIGGGLAGWVSAIHLARAGIEVLLIEKKEFPFHKFCGEYLSREVLPYLESLGLFPEKLGAKKIQRFRLSSHTGKYVEAKLPLGGLGIRRYSLDAYLAESAQDLGVNLISPQEVRKISFEQGIHHVLCKDKSSYSAPILIGAYGKRSILDKNLDRDFMKASSAYIGVKYYFEYEFPEDLVALHNFQGGYCGMSRMEDGSLNMCYLSKKGPLTQTGSISELEQQVLAQNPYIEQVLNKGKKLLAKPLVISNISFEAKELIKDHVLMCGDSAGMIFPLAGNGMAMSIHGAKILSELILDFFQQKISRIQLEQAYETKWRKTFSSRLAWGRQLQPAMGHNILSSLAVSGLRLMPHILKYIIKQTHGKPLYAYTKA